MLTLPLKVQGLISSQRVKSGHAVQTRAGVLRGGAALLGKIVGMGINVVSSWNLLCHAHVSTLPACNLQDTKKHCWSREAFVRQELEVLTWHFKQMDLFSVFSVWSDLPQKRCLAYIATNRYMTSSPCILQKEKNSIENMVSLFRSLPKQMHTLTRSRSLWQVVVETLPLLSTAAKINQISSFYLL